MACSIFTSGIAKPWAQHKGMQALWMILGAFSFATMGVGLKVASGSFNIFELVLYCGLVGVLVMGWFYAIAHLPLATAMTLNYTSGVWVSAFILGGALLFGKAQRQGALMSTVLLGFGGVILMLRPTMDQNQLFAGLIGLLSGVSAALAYIQVSALGKAGEPVERTVFFFALGGVLTGAVGLLWTGFTPWANITWQAAAWIVPIGLLGWLGMALIIASGVAATFLRERALPDTPAEEH